MEIDTFGINTEQNDRQYEKAIMVIICESIPFDAICVTSKSIGTGLYITLEDKDFIGEP